MKVNANLKPFLFYLLQLLFIVKLDGNSYNLVFSLNTSNGLYTNKTYHGVFDFKNNLYIASENGLIVFNNKKIKYILKSNGLISNDIWGIETSKNKEWIATISYNGLNLIKNEKVINNNNLDKFNKIINKKEFRSFYFDKEFLFLKYLDSNIINFKIDLKTFRYYIIPKKNEEIIKFNNFSLRYHYRFNQDILDVFEKKSLKKHTFNFIDFGDKIKQVFSKDDQLFVQLANNNIVILDNKLKKKKINLLGIKYNSFIIKNDWLIVFTNDGVQFLKENKLQKQNDFKVSFTSDFKGIVNLKSERYIKDYIEYDKDSLLLATSVSLILYRKNSIIDFDALHRYFNQKVYSICKDTNNKYFLGSFDGLYYSDNFNVKKVKLPPKLSIDIFNILKFKENYVLNTNGEGIVAYNKQTGKITQILKGILSPFNRMIRIDDVGNLWILSNEYLIKYDGENFQNLFDNDYLVLNSIKDFEVKNNVLFIKDNKNKVLSLAYSNQLEERLPFEVVGRITNKNELNIRASIMYFTLSKNFKFRYKIIRNNDSSEWKSISNMNNFSLSNLQHGHYKILIQVYNIYNSYMKSDIKILKFEIEPFWYQRPIVWILFSILLVSITALGLFQSYKRRQNRIMKKLATESKLNLYRLNGLQNQMNPHFVFNSLNTLQYLIATKEEEKTNQYLVDFSLLMREMLDQSRHLEISLEDEIRFLKKYISLEKIRFSDTFDCKWKNSIAEEEWSEIFIPNMLIQPLIENAIKYGIPNSNEGAKFIEIKMDLLETNILEVKIIDHGKWIERASLSGKAHSLMITKERVELYEKNGVKGNLDIMKNCTGTEVKLNIPI
jgi:sensor histidine kinase YesM